MRRWIVIIACWTVWCVCCNLGNLVDIFSAFSLFCFSNLLLLMQGNDMDSSRGVLSGTMDKFKMVCRLATMPFEELPTSSPLSLSFFSFSSVLGGESGEFRDGWCVTSFCWHQQSTTFVCFVDFLVSSFRYSRQNPAGECFHLLHPLS